MNFKRFLTWAAYLGTLALATFARGDTVEVTFLDGTVTTCSFASYDSNYSPNAGLKVTLGGVGGTGCGTTTASTDTTVNFGVSTPSSITSTLGTTISIPVTCAGPGCSAVQVSPVTLPTGVTLVSNTANAGIATPKAISLQANGSTTTPLPTGSGALRVTFAVTGATVVKSKSAAAADSANVSYGIDVNAPGTAGDCLATKCTDPGLENNRTVVLLKGTETQSIKFAPKRGNTGTNTTGHWTFIRATASGPAAAGLQYQVSETQNDFAPWAGNPACGKYFVFSEVSLYTTAGTTASYCRIDATKTYWINVRYVDPATGLSTCPAGTTCASHVTPLY